MFSLNSRAILAFSTIALAFSAKSDDKFYQEPAWVPRATLPYEDAINNDFWPASPDVGSHFNDPDFKDDLLPKLPKAGVHPRVCLTPDQLEEIREKVALGDKASAEFRALWEREKKKSGAFYALVVQDHELGKELAKDLMNKVTTLEPKLASMDAQKDGENLWSLQKSMVAAGEKDAPTEVWSLLDYDYLYQWLSEKDRQRIRKIVARVTERRISNFHNVPDHFMINNHQNFGMAYIRLMLLIEGEEGFNQELFDASVKKVKASLDWYLNKDGMCFESIKGWLNSTAIHTVALRDRKMLKHSHLQAKMKFFLQALRWEDGHWLIRDEMRQSAFHVIWMMRHYRPQSKELDLLYHASLNTHEALINSKERWRNPVGMNTELMLVFAKGKAENLADWTQSASVEKLKLPKTWKDDKRGYMIARNSWKQDDLKLGFTCKQDFFYGGHEGSEANRFTLWSDGVNWARDVNMLSAKATWLQNMLTIDGEGLAWPPTPGVWLGVEENDLGITASGDAKVAYSHSKHMQIHALNWESAKLPYFGAFVEKNYDMTRDLQVAYHPETIKFNDGYAHTDYGPWSTETRLVENYHENNPMKQVYRTIHLAKGKRPYVLVIDDANKDDLQHLYEWNMTLPKDVELLEAQTPEIQYQRVESSHRRDGEMILTRPNTPRDPKTGDLIIKKGDPLCLVRILWRNSNSGFPVPRLQRFDGQPEQAYNRFSHLCIPAISTSPEFRVMIYPYRHGEPLPKTRWNGDRTQLQVFLDGVQDTYDFAKTDGGRTVFKMTRNGGEDLVSSARPSRPWIKVRGQVYDPNDLRSTQKEKQLQTYSFLNEVEVKMEPLKAPSYIAYTLDGSEPSEASAKYESALTIKNASPLKYRQINPAWISDQKNSKVVTVAFNKRALPNEELAENVNPGVHVRLYEINTKMWNDKGFFHADKVMLPNLNNYQASYSTVLEEVRLPEFNPKAKRIEQSKAFYRFNGYINAEENGVYDFSLKSCGPVLLKIAGQNVIDHRGVFHQQLDTRSGDAVLRKGLNSFELIVCDPQFWNVNSLGTMPFEFKYAFEGGELQDLKNLVHKVAGKALDVEIQVPRLKAQKPPQWMRLGAVEKTYFRSGLRDANNYLDIDDADVFSVKEVTALKANKKPSMVYAYDAWLKAPVEGLYQFDLPLKSNSGYFMGRLRMVNQNQLRINDQVIVQHGVYGRNPVNKAYLEKGWHRISLRLGASGAQGRVTFPDNSVNDLESLLQIEDGVSILPDFTTEQLSSYEIYEKTKVKLALPQGRDALIRYRLDGKKPRSSDPIYKGPLTVDNDTVLTAAPFKDGQQLAKAKKVEFKKLNKPQYLRLIECDFSKSTEWLTKSDQSTSIWVNPQSKIVKEGDFYSLAGNQNNKKGASASVSTNVNLNSKSNDAFKLEGLDMKKPALTIALYFRAVAGEKASGTILSKQGYNAYGKGYKTINARLMSGKLRLDPGIIQSREKISNDWNVVFLTVSPEEFRIYLNNNLVAKDFGNTKMNTDSFDFFTKIPVNCRYVAVYNRILSERDLDALYKSLVK